jgi:trans-aconitate methyltransferase
VHQIKEYVERFKRIVREAFLRQANARGVVEVTFNRIFLVAVK